MPLVARGTTFERSLPDTGLHMAVCVDVIDLGEEQTPWKNDDGSPKVQHKCRIVWELDQKHPDFEGPHRVSQKFTLSLNEKANLRKELERWRGRAFTDKELEGFDLETLIGVSCQVNVIHSEDGQWANIDAILPPPKGQKLAPSGHYTRSSERGETAVSDYGDNFAAEQDEDELPF